MSRVATYLKSRVRRLVLARVGGQGIDLSQLDKVPDSLAWPLHRDGPDPVARLGELRDAGPGRQADVVPRHQRVAGHR